MMQTNKYGMKACLTLKMPKRCRLDWSMPAVGWGWSSQAAHWAMIFRYYQGAFGAREEDLGSVAMQVPPAVRPRDA